MSDRAEIQKTIDGLAAHVERPLPEADRRKLLDQIYLLQWELSDDPWYWMTHLARTKDEHAVGKGLDPYRPFPQKDYLRATCETLQHPDHQPVRLLIPKSRQIMMSWFIVALLLWRCLRMRAQLCGIQAQKAEDANDLIMRAFHIWEGLPAILREKLPCRQKELWLSFPSQRSDFRGFARGADQVRRLTFSAFAVDEAAFVDDLAATLTSIQPTLDQDAWALVFSSAKMSSFFQMVLSPEVPGTREVLVPSWHELNGSVRWRTDEHWTVLRHHYSADPEKDFGWAEEASKSYIGGMRGVNWRAEMDIDPGAKLGTLVYENFSERTHVVDVEMRDAKDWSKFLVVDPGYVNPCAVLFCAMDGDGTRYICDEIYVTQTSVPDLCKMIWAKRAAAGWFDTDFNLIGRDAFNSTQVAAGKTIAEQFQDYHLPFSPADTRKQAGILAVQTALMIRGNGEPGLKIGQRCRNTIQEMRNYRYEELTPEELLRKNRSEEPLKYNDHAMDALRYFCVGVPDGYITAMSIPSASEEEMQRRRALTSSYKRQRPRDYDWVGGGDPYDELYDA